MLTELKEASDILATAPGSDNGETNKLDRAYGYNTAKWRAYANSMRMRLSMRLSEVDPTTAKTHFEEAAAAGGITSASDRFELAYARHLAVL